MIELFVEGQPVDINESFSTLVTYAIDDIREFGAKNTAFSKTIILPGTARNNKLFGNIFDVSGGNSYDPILPNKGINFNAAVTASAYIFCDNIQIVKGVFRIMEVVNDNGFIEYEAFVTGELGGFAAKLGNKKLEDLDFSDYDHNYTIAEIVASWDNASAGQGYYYPLIDYGGASVVKHDWKYKTFRPSLFAKEYIDKIFTLTGYTYDCALFSTTRFKSLIVPSTLASLQKVSSNFLDVSALDSYSGAALYHIDFGLQRTLGEFTYSGSSLFTYGGSPTITGDINLRMNITYNKFPTQQIYIYLIKNGSMLESDVINYGPTDGTKIVDITASNISFSTGDTLEVQIFGFGDGSNFSFTINISDLTYTPAGGASIIVPVTLGEQFQMNANLPKNILQKDFISSIVKLFNLYIFEDPLNDKVLKIKPFIDFYTDAEVEDWSLKLDRSQPIRIKPMSELNARYYEFLFKDDNDYWNEVYKKRYNQTYGSLVYDSEYEFVKEVQKVEVIFSGTPLVGYTGEDKVYSTIFKRNGTGGDLQEESIDSNIRLLLAKKITGVTSWSILDTDSDVLGSYTYYGYAGHFDDPDAPANDIQFGVPRELFFTLATGAINVNQFNVYWSSYMAEITDKDSRLLTGTFKLDYRDIYNLDFSKFKYIDGVLFRLNKIIDFNATNEDTCKCELLKVINKTY